jgi:hypothetical protein
VSAPTKPEFFDVHDGAGELQVRWRLPASTQIRSLSTFAVAIVASVVFFATVSSTQNVFYFGLYFPALGIVSGYMALAGVVNYTTVTVASGELRARRGPIPIGGSVTISCTAIHSLEVEPSGLAGRFHVVAIMTRSSAGGDAEVCDKTAKKKRVVKWLRQPWARYLAATLASKM